MAGNDSNIQRRIDVGRDTDSGHAARGFRVRLFFYHVAAVSFWV